MATKKFRAEDVQVETLLREGNTVQEILKTAREGGFDLIVIGARGISRIGEILLGSVSDGVIRNTPCPVLVTFDGVDFMKRTLSDTSFIKCISLKGYDERGFYNSVFRGYKMDRSSIVGAVVALERYMNIMRNPEKALQPARNKLNYLMRGLKDIPDIKITVIDAHTKGVDPTYNPILPLSFSRLISFAVP